MTVLSKGFSRLDFSRKSLDQYSQLLSSESAVPGGGSAAAYTGVMGISLVMMSIALSLKRAPALKKYLPSLEKDRKTLLKWVSEDSKVFLKNRKHFAGKKGSPVYEKACLQCAEAPMQIAKVIARSVSISLKLDKKINQWLISDLLEGILLMDAATQAAMLNVKANTRLMTRSVFRGQLDRQVTDLATKVHLAMKKAFREAV